MQNRRVPLLMVLTSALLLLSCGGGGSPNEFAPGPPVGTPEVTGLNPQANAPSAMLGAAVTATFDQNMDPASAATFVVYGDQTGKLAGVYVGGGTDTLSFNPNLGFKIGEQIEVVLTDMLTSTGGISLESPFVYRFRAEALGGSGNFAVANTVVNQTDTRALVAGDWDGDGDLDLASANNGDNQVDILFNNGAGVFTGGNTVDGQTNTSGLAAGDWDADGDLDVASANFGNNDVDVLENQP